MTSKPGKQASTIHVLPNISQSKDNQTMKFDLLIDHNKRNICLAKLFYHILRIIFQEKCFSCYILLTDQVSLSCSL